MSYVIILRDEVIPVNVEVLSTSDAKKEENIPLSSIIKQTLSSTDHNQTENSTKDTILRTTEAENCYICGDTSHAIENCSYAPVSNHIQDKEVLTRARLSIPDCLELKKLADNSDCVYAKQFIPSGTEFGPFHAKKQSTLNPLINFPLKIIGNDGTILHYFDSVDENECNWMIFVNSANYVEDQNLVCYQKNLEIHFATVKDIQPGEPLRVWYAPFYASKLGKELLGFETLVRQEKQEKKLLNDLITKHQNVVPRSTWSCKFCYKLETNVVTFASHLLMHYQYKKQNRCEACKKKFSDKTKLVNHIKYSQCSKNIDNIKEIKSPTENQNVESEDTVTKSHTSNVCDKSFSTKHNLMIHSTNIHGMTTTKTVSNLTDSVGGPLLHFDPEICSLDQGNIFLDGSQSNVNLLDVTGENYNVGNENLTLSVDILLNQNVENIINPKIDTSEAADELIHTCDICLKKFKTLRAINEHLTAHTGRYNCSECKKVFTRQEALKSHKCFRQYCLKCSLCGLVFYQEKYLKHHMEVKHKRKFSCKKCFKCFNNHRELENHNCSRVSMENKKKFNCLKCNKIFFMEKYLRRHLKTHQKNTIVKDLSSCDICGQTFLSQESHRRHLRLQHKEAFFECNVCDKKFTRRDTLKEHLVELHGIGSQESQCHLCNKIYASKKKLGKHLRLIHGKTNKTPKKVRTLDTENGFACPICKKKVKLKSSLHRHIKDIHSLDITVTSKTSNPDVANPKRIYTGPENDLPKKENGFECPFCGIITKLRNSLRRHIKNKHPQQKLVIPKDTQGYFKDKTAEINAELDRMIEDDVFKDLKQSIEDLDFTTGMLHTMDNLIETDETTIDALLKEKSANLNTSAFNLSDDISIIPVSSKKQSRKDIFLSMPDLIDE